ncbi:hypothetical protein QYM36_018992 [Artemia franciscana]|uniref:Uncharacterized protein n=1 Tax=Artemia franciscana TaxID=6661 RepID=A0AA88HBN2_ARTSF|nr:hypothetical protein QYM36_018992 [Artemia franciscana]
MNYALSSTCSSGIVLVEQHIVMLAWLYSRCIDLTIKSDFFCLDLHHNLINSNLIHFDILVQETWNKTMTRSLEFDSAMHFTILRNPVDAFESLFHYIDMAKFYNVSSFPEFIKKLNSSDPIRSDRLYGAGRNQLSFNLGLPVKHFDNMDMIKKKSKEIEKRFNLVMISEYFEESLIFLKNLLRIPLIHVMSTKSNARHQESRHILTVGEKDILSNWLNADIYLYQLFRSNIPVIGPTVADSVVLQVNVLNRKTGVLIQTKLNKQKVSGFTSSNIPSNQLQRNAKSVTYTKILKNCPNLCLPEKRKQFVDYLCPAASKYIELLKGSEKKNEKFVVRCKNTANSMGGIVKEIQQI